MSDLAVQDLELDTAADLDSQALVAITGGNNGAGNFSSNGPVTSLIGLDQGGISLFSPTIVVNTVMSLPTTVQTAMVQDNQTSLDLTNYVNSVLAAYA